MPWCQSSHRRTEGRGKGGKGGHRDMCMTKNQLLTSINDAVTLGNTQARSRSCTGSRTSCRILVTEAGLRLLVVLGV